MRRREFITLIGGAAAGWPLSARAQRTAIPQIGLLDPGVSNLFAAFEQGMRDLGYIEGQTVSYLRASAEGRAERVPQLAAELVARNPDVIVTAATLPVHAVQERTSKIPIVFAALGDAVGLGVVSNLARPGGNLTGISNQVGGEASGKVFQVLKETVPKLSKLGIIWNPDNQASAMSFREIEVPASNALRVALVSLEVRGPGDLDHVFTTITSERPDALWFHLVAFPYRVRLLEFAAKNRLPTIAQSSSWPEAGGLMSYGPDPADLYRRAAAQVAKILKGAKPADLPVEQPTKFELVINLKTAKALGLTIPPSLLQRADQVIE